MNNSSPQKFLFDGEGKVRWLGEDQAGVGPLQVIQQLEGLEEVAEKGLHQGKGLQMLYIGQ